MRKLVFAVFAVTLMLVVAGCGDGHGPSSIVTQIPSNVNNDGDIELTTGNTLIVTQGNPGSVFAGVDTATGSEFRAFLDFPLANVPSNAIIDSATLEVFINDVTITSLPILIELVALPTQTLQGAFFDTPTALATKSTFVRASDINKFVAFDVTNLMVEAQIRGLSRFQVRILQDFNVPDGLFEIEDALVNREPLLEVVYH